MIASRKQNSNHCISFFSMHYGNEKLRPYAWKNIRVGSQIVTKLHPDNKQVLKFSGFKVSKQIWTEIAK